MGGRSDPGSRVRSDYRCGSCGYGVVAVDLPLLCPMCGSSTWNHAPWRPFSYAAAERLDPAVDPPQPPPEPDQPLISTVFRT